MLIALLWGASFAAGILWQRRRPDQATAWNRRIFNAYFNLLAPVVILFAYSSVPADRATLIGLGAVILASWLVLGVGGAYARAVARSREEQGALMLGSGFTNTVTLGYPVANAVFGPPGLALQVLFGQFMYLIPIISVSTTIAAHFGNGTRPRSWLGILRQVASVPLAVAVIAVVLRVAGVDITGLVDEPAAWVAFAMGPIGFLELGLALPLDRISHTWDDLWRAMGPVLIRLLMAPAILLGLDLALGADVPAPYYLAIAMPAAFHTLILARVFALPGAMMRLIVLLSTAIMLAGVFGWLVLFD